MNFIKNKKIIYIIICVIISIFFIIFSVFFDKKNNNKNNLNENIYEEEDMENTDNTEKQEDEFVYITGEIKNPRSI